MNFFYNLKIKYKLIIIYSVIFITCLGIINSFIYIQYKSTLEKSIKEQLNVATAGMVDMVKAAADTSIKNHLRTVADTHLTFINHYYDLYKEGIISEDKAKQLAKATLLSQKIGTTGYM